MRSPHRRTVLWGLVTLVVAAGMLASSTEHAGAQTALEQTVQKLARPVPAPPDVAAAPADAVKTATGLATKVVTPGAGTARPGPLDTVTVHYTGWTTSGAMFDSSYARGRTSTFVLSRVIPGWSETVQLMVIGEKRRAWIPEALAYKGAEGKPKGLLVFDIELVGFTEAPVTPPDVAAAPADAQQTTSGLAYRVLRPGAGAAHPKSSSTVTVHYSGWTTDGQMFDSSVVRGEPASFGLNQVIKGWTEGVQLMVEGEKTRFWIPSKLAYDGAPDRPQGMLVFDVELIKIEK
ncbi:MAG: FKBP-type peptidyl-prolyl cis-trans isomerase [Acidobacteriota bacterium]